MRRLVIFLIILPGLFSCDMNHAWVNNEISPIIQDLAIFQPGSYWIYKNDFSGQEDSVWITENIEVDIEEEEYPGLTVTTENISLWKSSVLSGTWSENFQLYYGNFSNNSLWTTFITDTTRNEVTQSFRVVYYGISDSIIWNSNLFENVYHFEDTQATDLINNWTQTSVHFYYQKGIGLIHFEIEGSPNRWTAIRWNVTQ